MGRGLGIAVHDENRPFRTRPPRRQLTFIFMRYLLRAGLVDAEVDRMRGTTGDEARS
jgi:hypothetical protein